MNTESATQRRRDMVRQQIQGRGVRDPKVLRAMEAVPREAFVSDSLAGSAYDDTPLPIAAEQTISQPYIVAFMVEALGLSGSEKVLEIGTGSGYAAAVLAEVVKEVFTVERIPELVDSASGVLTELGYDRVHVKCDDGTLGWPEQAPFDAIIVAAGGPHVPEQLKTQLSVGGRLVMPVGQKSGGQELVRVTRLDQASFRTEVIASVRFVPLIGSEGW